ncbi:hypothetical protein MAPG_08087 [Magnaporthiopsis poae ATCC 64411]|uniref:Uncharacterized protein n=1 Tax=Magnaporthiopsis poae (strain ATCC 64411 / 73-15) TaxID=644358 RepID=A0A0C4E6F3_MAGP6|nr:hypothetical protein MAPG_08087 [Magnaporthiopsis poae ATCC 64411]
MGVRCRPVHYGGGRALTTTAALQSQEGRKRQQPRRALEELGLRGAGSVPAPAPPSSRGEDIIRLSCNPPSRLQMCPETSLRFCLMYFLRDSHAAHRPKKSVDQNQTIPPDMTTKGDRIRGTNGDTGNGKNKGISEHGQNKTINT